VASTSIPADPQLLPTQYSAAQLASLAEPYHFHWNAAIVFVVIISCLITAISSIFALHFISRIWINKRRKVDVGIGQSYLIEREGLKKSRPTRRTIDALRGEKIASPMPSSGAHSGGFNRSSDGTGEFSGSGREYEVNHGC
jgi:hypothetical protein